MRYMAVPVSFRWDEDFVKRIDGARGDVSRSRFVRRAVERALVGPTVTGSHVGAIAEQPQYEHLATCTCWICRPPVGPPRVRSSSEARPFRPVPKKGER